MNGTARWVPHQENPSDCLTKLKGNTARLLELIQKGSYKLVMEDSELAARKESRAQTGKRNPRPKRQLISQNHEIVQNKSMSSVAIYVYQKAFMPSLRLMGQLGWVGRGEQEFAHYPPAAGLATT